MKNEPTSNPHSVRVFFLGSGALGVPVLEALLTDPRLAVAGVATQPDRPAGRHRQMTPTPLGARAAAAGLAVIKPVSVNTPEFLGTVGAAAPELVVVVAFGQILKRALLEAAPFGCLNVHPSLLPRHRGAAPVAAAILHGDAQTGVCLMKMDAGLDTGPVYRTVRVPLTGTETTDALERQLGAVAAAAAADCVWAVCREGLGAVPQAAEGATYAPRLRKDDGAMDWALPAVTLERRVRAYQPWPRLRLLVRTERGARQVQVLQAAVVPQPPGIESLPGTVLQADRDGWTVACGQDAIRLLRVIPEGAREMTAAAFLRGWPVPVGTILRNAPGGTSSSEP